MRVSQTGNSPVQNPDTRGVAGAKQATKANAAHAAKTKEVNAGAAEAAAQGAAKTEISSRAKELAKAKEVATSAPDVREEKIAALKAKIAAGKYNVNPEAVADRMVDEHLKAGIG
ncbi:MAG: flagellar biosynthesis anti-sigma factor FlgM [Oligoflexia bacterium]|nr:flagellar biosynthesis anti-sigma factor FlgM [Oligoflexia bacterium]